MPEYSSTRLIIGPAQAPALILLARSEDDDRAGEEGRALASAEDEAPPQKPHLAPHHVLVPPGGVGAGRQHADDRSIAVPGALVGLSDGVKRGLIRAFDTAP